MVGKVKLLLIIKLNPFFVIHEGFWLQFYVVNDMEYFLPFFVEGNITDKNESYNISFNYYFINFSLVFLYLFS